MLERRGFVGAMLGASLAPNLVGKSLLPTEEWDLSFLNRLTGKHRMVFDVGDMESGLIVAKNWYDAHEEVFKLRHPDLNGVVGIARRAFPINASDALYEKFPIGELWKVNDPQTGAPARRNVFMAGGTAPHLVGAGVRPLMARGAVFWMCNNALQRVASQIGDAVKRPAAEVYPELRAALNPGVILIPAHTMLLGLCQERGCAYEAI